MSGDVRFDFIVEFAVGPALAEETANSRKNAAKPCRHHYRWPSKRKTRPIIPEMVSQLAVSIANCFCPRLVIE